MQEQKLRTQTDIFQDRDVQIGAAVGLIVGLLLGWFALGWWIAPVQWVDAKPSDLHPDWQDNYVAMVADSYLLTGDTQIARARLKDFDTEALKRVFGKVEAKFEHQEATRQARAVRQLADQMGISIVLLETPVVVETAAAQAVATATPVPEQGEASGTSVGQVIVWAFVIMFVIVASVGGFMWLQRRSTTQFEDVEGAPGQPGRRPPGDLPIESMNVGERKIIEYQDEGPGYEQDIQIYQGGEIVGSCGLQGVPTLSESGHVVACATWLYEPQVPDRAADTRVLVSRRVYENATLRSSLVDDRQPESAIPAESGQTVYLEHETLEMALRVIDVEYADLGEQYIRRLVVEFEPVRKRRPPDEPSAPLDFSIDM
ncbi:MAG: hypothetical protein MAG451_02364 [Anaerolineales bacterium]|nr:hypothetical protein [Anaerolineales bacterium]